MNKNIITTFIFSFVIGAGVGAAGMYTRYSKKVEFADKYAFIAETEQILADNGISYEYNDYARDKLINGYLSVYDDKYTSYSKKDTTSVWGYSAIFNEYPVSIGCGISFAYDSDRQLYISYIVPGGIADKAGIIPGDRVVSVNDVEFDPDNTKYLAAFNGEEGTVCTVKLKRGSEYIVASFKRHNDELSANNYVSAEIIDDIAYVRIGEFDSNTDLALESELNDLPSGYKATIVDLRDNGGGWTQVSVNVAAFLGASGAVHFHPYSGEEWQITPEVEKGFDTGKIIVLVNERTTSAAEVQTALLKQYADATIVGTNTFGKGIYQEVEPLKDGGKVKFTQGTYTVGEWECYHGVGIKPDYEVEMDSSLKGTADDIQLKKAFELLDE